MILSSGLSSTKTLIIAHQNAQTYTLKIPSDYNRLLNRLCVMCTCQQRHYVVRIRAVTKRPSRERNRLR